MHFYEKNMTSESFDTKIKVGEAAPLEITVTLEIDAGLLTTARQTSETAPPLEQSRNNSFNLAANQIDSATKAKKLILFVELQYDALERLLKKDNFTQKQLPVRRFSFQQAQSGSFSPAQTLTAKETPPLDVITNLVNYMPQNTLQDPHRDEHYIGPLTKTNTRPQSLPQTLQIAIQEAKPEQPLKTLAIITISLETSAIRDYKEHAEALDALSHAAEFSGVQAHIDYIAAQKRMTQKKAVTNSYQL